MPLFLRVEKLTAPRRRLRRQRQLRRFAPHQSLEKFRGARNPRNRSRSNSLQVKDQWGRSPPVFGSNELSPPKNIYFFCTKSRLFSLNKIIARYSKLNTCRACGAAHFCLYY